MIVKLWDKTELIVTPNEGEQIKQMIEKDYKFIEIHGMMIRPSAIMLIKPGGNTQPTLDKLPKPKDPDAYRRGREQLEKMREKHWPPKNP